MTWYHLTHGVKMEIVKKQSKVLDLKSATLGVTSVNKSLHSTPAAYILYHEASGMFYVGSTSNLYIRITDHLKDLRGGRHRNEPLQQAYSKHENKNLRLSFIRSNDREIAFDLEQDLLDKYIPTGKLFNLATNARIAGLGRIVPEEQRVKQVAKLREFFKSEKGSKQLEEQITRMKGLWRNPEVSKKLYAEHAERRNDPVYMKKLAENGKAVWTDPKMREKMLAIRAKRRRPVSIDGIVYDCVGDASKALGIQLGTLRKRLEAGRPGYYFTIKEGSK